MHAGWCYKNGQGVQSDFSRAFELYKRAAQQNHPGAQNNLAVKFSFCFTDALKVCYEYGDGTKRNMFLAALYYRMSRAGGEQLADTNLTNLMRRFPRAMQSLSTAK
jgi:TPR repeat protein